MQNGNAPPVTALMTLEERLAFYGNLQSGLVAQAERDGTILTVSRVSPAPFAMGKHRARVDAYVSAAARRANEERHRIVIAPGVVR